MKPCTKCAARRKALSNMAKRLVTTATGYTLVAKAKSKSKGKAK